MKPSISFDSPASFAKHAAILIFILHRMRVVHGLDFIEDPPYSRDGFNMNKSVFSAMREDLQQAIRRISHVQGNMSRWDDIVKETDEDVTEESYYMEVYFHPNTTSTYHSTKERIEADIEDSEDKLKIFSLLLSVCAATFVKAGYSLRHSSLARVKNMNGVAMMNMNDLTYGVIAWYLIGYSWAYGKENYPETTANGMMGLTYQLSRFSDSSIHWARWILAFQSCNDSYTIMSGSILERVSLKAYIFPVISLAAVLWPTCAHAIWSEDGWASPFRDINTAFHCGVLDHVGSFTHVIGGLSALAFNLVIGPRKLRYDDQGHLVPFVQCSSLAVNIGVGFIFMGTIYLTAFNNEIGKDGMFTNARAAVNTVFAGIGGAFFATLTGWFKDGNGTKRVFSVELAAGGTIAGLAAIAAGGPFVSPPIACYIGGFAGILHVFVGKMVIKFIDDTSSAIAIHFVGGTWGLVAVGFFNNPDYYRDYFEARISKDFLEDRVERCVGGYYGGTTQLAAQLVFTLWVIFLTLPFMLSAIVFFNEVAHLRVSAEAEKDGLDRHYFGGLHESIPPRLNMTLNPVTWPEFQEVAQVSKTQRKDEETLSVINEVKEVAKKVAKAKTMKPREKKLFAKFNYECGCLLVKPGIQTFRGQEFYIPGDTGVLWVPRESYELKERILTYYINLFSTGLSLQKIQNSTEKDDQMIEASPAEYAVRMQFFWPELQQDFMIERDRQEVMHEIRKAEQYKNRAEQKSTWQKIQRLWTRKKKSGSFREDKKEMKNRKVKEEVNSKNPNVYHGHFNDPEEIEVE